MQEAIQFELERQDLDRSEWEYEHGTAVLVVQLERAQIRGYSEQILEPTSGGAYEGFYVVPITGPQSSVVLTGKLMVEDAGTLRQYDPKQDGGVWPLSGATAWSPAATVKANGTSNSSASVQSIRPDGTFSTTTASSIDGTARQLSMTAIVELKGGKRLGASVVLELIDLQGFLAIVDPKEQSRPASQSHLEFLASVRKVFQGGPSDPLAGLFDLVLYRNRNVKPIFAPGSAEEKRLLRYRELYAGGERLDIGHVLTGMEGALKQSPSKDQQIPVPVRPDLKVTWAGDLGSSLQQYLKDFLAALDQGNPIDLNPYLVKYAGSLDLIGDVDGVNAASSYDPGHSLAENLNAYYGNQARRRFHEFIANSLDDRKMPAMPLGPGSNPPRVSDQGKKWIALQTRNYLLPFWVAGKLDRNLDAAGKELVNSILQVGSPEMDDVANYFAQFLDNGLARETQTPVVQHESQENETFILTRPNGAPAPNPAIGASRYLNIKLNGTVPPKVGVFIPANYRSVPDVDLIVYFHGHIIPACNTEEGPFLAKGIEYYWATPLFKCLRDDLARSARQAILIAPTFKPIFGNSYVPANYGDLNQDGKFDFLINETLTQLRQDGTLPAGARARNIILSGHSAGGLPMRDIVHAQNSLQSRIAECWGFECLYFGTPLWEEWLKANPGSSFLHFRRATVFLKETCALMKYKNFSDVANGKDHCSAVMRNWRQAIDSSRVLQGGVRSGVVPVPTTPAVCPPSIAPRKRAVRGRSQRESAPVEWDVAHVPDPSEDGFVLTEGKLETGKIEVARIFHPNADGKTGLKVSITEAPAVFLPQIIGMARDMASKERAVDLAARLNPATWFKKYTTVAFLGRSLQPGEYFHLEMAKTLKAIEGAMVKKYGGDAKSVGDKLLNNSSDSLYGSRLVSATATFSMHMFGLAVDINYLGDPYIHTAAQIKALNNVLKNAAMLLNQLALSYQQDASDKFDSVQRLDTMLRHYFSLVNDPAELTRLAQASASPVWRGLSPSDARTKVQSDLKGLASWLKRGENKDYFKHPSILNFDKRFVVQMEAMGLSWGGPYGDMMHFDMRTTGVGRHIQNARLLYQKHVNDQAKTLFDAGRYGEYSPTFQTEPSQG